MHRELSTVDEPFRPASPVGLYALTALVGALLAADLGPLVAGWLKGQGVDPYTWSPALYGFLHALIPPLLRGARPPRRRRRPPRPLPFARTPLRRTCRVGPRARRRLPRRDRAARIPRRRRGRL